LIDWKSPILTPNDALGPDDDQGVSERDVVVVVELRGLDVIAKYRKTHTAMH
jgi:hypothetical protein